MSDPLIAHLAQPDHSLFLVALALSLYLSATEPTSLHVLISALLLLSMAYDGYEYLGD